MSNQELETAVKEELDFEPKVDAESVAVQADDGTVTLRGTVGSFFEKRAAHKAAEGVWGAVKVDNKLEVNLLVGGRRDDAELRGDVLQALMLDAMVPGSIDASVYEGVVTLSGEAQRAFERDEALRVAGNVRGVVDVWSDVVVTGPAPDTEDVQKSIKKAFKRNAKLDAKSVEVTSSNGTVTLEGTVSSWPEHDEALEVAWAAPGVRNVDDHLRVSY
jgi:osmotically-inducible protein OsmY